MDIKSFIKYNSYCPVCNSTTSLSIIGNLQETIDTSTVYCKFSFQNPIIRKNFLTFSSAKLGIYSPDEFVDLDTLNKNKYATLHIKDGYVAFDLDFKFKMYFSLSVSCINNHYSYSSRRIIVSNSSPDITKGYPIIQETINYLGYSIISNTKNNTTSISTSTSTPITIPIIDINSFPLNDPERFAKRVQNILLLA